MCVVPFILPFFCELYLVDECLPVLTCSFFVPYCTSCQIFGIIDIVCSNLNKLPASPFTKLDL